MAPANPEYEYEYESELHDEEYYEYTNEYREQLTFITQDLNSYIDRIYELCNKLKPVLDEDEDVIDHIKAFIDLLYDCNGEISRERTRAIKYEIRRSYNYVNSYEFDIEFSDDVRERDIENKNLLFVLITDMYVDYLKV